MVVWDWTLASIRPSELPLFILVFFSFGGTIIPLLKPKLYSIPRFENEKEKNNNKNKNNNFTCYGYTTCLFDGGKFFSPCACSSSGLSLARKQTVVYLYSLYHEFFFFFISVSLVFWGAFWKLFNCILTGIFFFFLNLYMEKISNGVLMWNSIIYRFLIVNVAEF